MKKTLYPFALILAAVTMTACGGKDEPIPGPNPGPNPGGEDAVEVTIATSTIETKANVALEFKSADKMNVFAKTYGRIDAPNIVDDVVATFDGGKWTMTPPVKIDANQKNAFVYAVAPYDPEYKDAQKIPVDLNKQVDLMYSGAYVPASLQSPAVTLKMKHALTLMTFNIVPVSYSGTGALTQAVLDGDIVYATGTMDASTGRVAVGEKGTVTAKFNKNVAAGGWKSDIPGMWVIPFNTKGGTANIKFTIDGKTYDLTVPEVEMKTGYQYIFRLALTSNGLEFDPSKTETRSLNVDSDSEINFQGFGRVSLKASGSWLFAPVFTGDAVFGTISAPKGNRPYSAAETVDGLTSGNNVVIESWNSTGFSLETLDGIDTIDLTEYE